MSPIEKPGYRKLIAFLVGSGCAVGLAAAGKLDPTAGWTILGLVGAFCGGNSLEHFARLRRAAKGENDGLP